MKHHPSHFGAKRRLLAGALIVGLSLPTLYWTGLANRLGLGPTPALRRAEGRIESLPVHIRLEGLGLTARVPSEVRCTKGFGFGCQSERLRVTWSACAVDAPAGRWARTPRTDTCDPNEGEEGIVPGGWDQEPVGLARIAGFDGFIVSWQPNTPHAMRGAGCSFRGHRRAPGGGWLLLHIEAAPACDDEILAMMLSTRDASVPLGKDSPN